MYDSYHTNQIPYPKFAKPHRTAVVYVIRKAEGKAAFIRFIDSIQRSASKNFDLFIVYKGFEGREEVLYEWNNPHVTHRYVSIEMRSDSGYDLTTYRQAAEALSHENIIFFNGTSELLADNWLSLFEERLEQYDLVGSTDSNETFQRGFWRRLIYSSFPNYHIRTNGFGIKRSVMLKVWPRKKFRIKLECFLFEAGYNSLTKRVPNNTCICAGTFRKAHPAILLDKQTRFWVRATEEERQELKERAWGK